MRALVFLLFISSTANANHFSTKDGPVRFDLSMTKEELRYRSHTISKTIPLTPCRLKFAQGLNAQLFQKLTAKSKGEFTVYVDDKPFKFDKGSPAAQEISTLELTVIALEVSMNKHCP